MIDGEKTICHVRNTGRLKELLTEKALVYLEKSSNPKRKTSCSLISVKKGNQIINIDSQIPNKVFHEHLVVAEYYYRVRKINHIKSESRYGSSRFDFYIESGNTKAYIEIKGVTLEENG